MRRKLLPLFLILLMSLIVACGGDKDEQTVDPESGQPTATATEEAVTPTDTPIPPTATPIPPTATPLPSKPTATSAAPASDDELTLTDAQLATLDALDSYRSFTLIEYEGINLEGDEETASIEFETEVVTDPPAQHFVIRGTGLADDDPDQADTPDSLDIYVIDDSMHLQVDGQWIQMSREQSPFNSPDMAVAFNSGVLFSDLEGARRVRPDEKINGIDSRHYTFDEDVVADSLAITDRDRTTVDGEVWIAIDGGFVTKYVIDMEFDEGSGGILAPDLASGTVHMEFELSSVNEDFVIELPESAGGAGMLGFEGEAFPVPEDANISMASPEFSMLQTALSPQDVQAFYEEALADLGWTKNEDASGAFGSIINLEFTRGPFILSLVITGESESGPTQIMAGVENSP